MSSAPNRHTSKAIGEATAPGATSLSTGARGATLLIALQVCSRSVTFLVNQVLIRYLSPELLGISTHLEVYSISVLFFARESLRITAQRQTSGIDVNVTASSHVGDKVEPVQEEHGDDGTTAGNLQSIVNLAYASILIGLCLANFFAWLYLCHTGQAAVIETPYFQLSLILYGLASFTELLSEPLFVVAQLRSQFSVRARAEACAVFSRSFATCGSALWAARNGRHIGVLPFALGQLGYAISLLAIYLFESSRITANGRVSVKPSTIPSSDTSAIVYSLVSRPLLILCGSIFAQSIVKHVLTQGDTVLIASLASQRAQGIYALVNNYGGLVARLILQPIEESSRNHFGRLLNSAKCSPSRDHSSKARNDLVVILRGYILLSVPIVSVGPTIAPLLLKIVAGPAWTESGAGYVLALYCYYIPLLAMNGITEAFVSSVATKSDVNRQSVWMLAFSAGFAGAAFVFLYVLEMGAKGLVWANALNMLFRISWSSSFIYNYLKHNGAAVDLGSLMPRPITVAVGAISTAVLSQLSLGSNGGMVDIVKGGTVAMVVLGLFVNGTTFGRATGLLGKIVSAGTRYRLYSTPIVVTFMLDE